MRTTSSERIAWRAYCILTLASYYLGSSAIGAPNCQCRGRWFELIMLPGRIVRDVAYSTVSYGNSTKSLPPGVLPGRENKSVCVCVRACVRACVCVRVCVCARARTCACSCTCAISKNGCTDTADYSHPIALYVPQPWELRIESNISISKQGFVKARSRMTNFTCFCWMTSIDGDHQYALSPLILRILSIKCYTKDCSFS